MGFIHTVQQAHRISLNSICWSPTRFTYVKILLKNSLDQLRNHLLGLPMQPSSPYLSSIHPITILQHLWLRPSKFLEPVMGTDSFSICVPHFMVLSFGFCTQTQEGWGKGSKCLPSSLPLNPQTCKEASNQRNHSTTSRKLNFTTFSSKGIWVFFSLH